MELFCYVCRLLYQLYCDFDVACVSRIAVQLS